jgi:3-methyladenine DNA glycosylase AlkD
MDVATEMDLLLQQIRQQAEPDYREGSAKVMRTQLVVHGVRMPNLRRIARDWKKEHKEIDRGELMLLVEALWQAESQEQRVLALELLRAYPGQVESLLWDHFERWRGLVDNWGLTDGLGSCILGPWIIADPGSRLGHLRDLIADTDHWSRRLALVATVPINRGHAGMTIPELTLELIDRVKHERDPMITKAVSWALREMTKTHPDQVAGYVKQNRGLLAAHVVRDVGNKLRTGLKSGRGRR